jgi:anti-sigma regulatory factor (Ser/Thr protein kinase)
MDVVAASTIEAISPVVNQLMHSLKTSCCPAEQEIAVEMALRESLANAIVHGNHEDLHKQVHVCCACDAKRGMLIVMKDQGRDSTHRGFRAHSLAKVFSPNTGEGSS